MRVGVARTGIRRSVSEPGGGTVRYWRTAVVATLAALVLVLVSTPSFGAVSTSGTPMSAAGSRDLPRREMNDRVVTNSKGWLIFKGNVDPGWNNRNVQIYKRTCLGCAWTLVKKVRTDGTGRWSTRIYAPRTDYWYWKGIVPKANDYGKSVTEIYRTYVV
jgi:hypothetical protein